MLLWDLTFSPGDVSQQEHEGHRPLPCRYQPKMSFRQHCVFEESWFSTYELDHRVPDHLVTHTHGPQFCEDLLIFRFCLQEVFDVSTNIRKSCRWRVIVDSWTPRVTQMGFIWQQVLQHKLQRVTLQGRTTHLQFEDVCLIRYMWGL